VQRPTMRFVPVKTAEQQASQLLHRGREQLVRQRTTNSRRPMPDMGGPSLHGVPHLQPNHRPGLRSSGLA
jgi:transposase